MCVFADGQGVRGRGRVCVCRWPECARKRKVCEVGQSVFRLARGACKSGVIVRRQDVFKRKDLLAAFQWPSWPESKVYIFWPRPRRLSCPREEALSYPVSGKTSTPGPASSASCLLRPVFERLCTESSLSSDKPRRPDIQFLLFNLIYSLIFGGQYAPYSSQGLLMICHSCLLDYLMIFVHF